MVRFVIKKRVRMFITNNSIYFLLIFFVSKGGYRDIQNSNVSDLQN